MKPIIFIILLSLFINCSSTPIQKSKMPVIESKTIVFIHGMFMASNAWDEWQKYFQAKGYKTFAPAWPLHDLSPQEMRAKHPDKYNLSTAPSKYSLTEASCHLPNDKYWKKEADVFLNCLKSKD